MRKRIALIAFLLLLLAAGGAAWWLSRNLDDIAKGAIQKYGSAMTQASVTVGALQLSPQDGKGSIQDLRIGNPKGFQTAHALQVGRIDLAIDIATVTDKVVVVRQIAIESPDVIYEKGSSGLTNFDALMSHITQYIGKTDGSGGGKKLIVQSLTIRGAKAHASAPQLFGKTVTVTLPDISLKDIGKAEGGVTPGELGGIVANAIRQRLTASISFDRLLQSGSQALDKAGAAIKGLFGGK